VHALHGVAGVFRSHQLHDDVDAADHENSVFCFHLACNFRNELAVTRINVTRFQRASKSAEHSTSRGRNHVIDRGGVGFGELGGVYLVVLGNGAMDAEYYRL
jgi:hypothetical protein